MRPLLALALIVGAVAFAFATRGTPAGKYAEKRGELEGMEYRVYWRDELEGWTGEILPDDDDVITVVSGYPTRAEAEQLVWQAIREMVGG